MADAKDYQPFKRLLRLLKQDKQDIAQVYIYSIFNGLLYLSYPLGIQALVNLIQGGQMSTSWIVLVVLVLLGITFTGVLQVMQLRITENLQQKIFTRSAFEFAYRLPRIKMEAIYNYYPPELVNRFFDTLTIQKGISKILIDISTATLQVIFGLILLSFYHSFFVLFSFLLVGMAFLIFKITGRRGFMASLKESKYKYELAHWLEELARSHISFKMAGNSSLPLEKANVEVDLYLDAREKHFKILVQQFSMMVVFKVLIALGLLVIGGVLVMQQQMNIGQFVAAEIIIMLVMASVEKLVVSLESIYDVLTSLEKLGQVVDLELEHNKGIDLGEECHSPGMKIDVNNLHFTYPESLAPTLTGLSLNVEACEKICVSGSNGSGKSTLLNLLAGMYDLQMGSISYNNLSIGSLNPSSLRSVIGECLSQETIFQGTLLENITIGRSGASFENVKWAVESLGLKDFIRKLPEGYNTMLSSDAKNLPRSIATKILLARSIADKPHLLLLEDNLDRIEEIERNKIIDFLTASDAPWTLLAVSTNAYLARACDRTVIMAAGTIAETCAFNTLKDKSIFKDKDNA